MAVWGMIEVQAEPQGSSYISFFRRLRRRLLGHGKTAGPVHILASVDLGGQVVIGYLPPEFEQPAAAALS
jgi:hypothetical protein